MDKSTIVRGCPPPVISWMLELLSYDLNHQEATSYIQNTESPQGPMYPSITLLYGVQFFYHKITLYVTYPD